MRPSAVRLAALALAMLALQAPRAAAQGYGVYEHDACTMARAGAGVAAPCNASAIFFNPAGIVAPANSSTKWNISVGATSVGADFAFTDAATGSKTPSSGGSVLVPAAHITMQLNNRWAFGIGAFAPYGLVSEWPTTFDGRFLGYRSELKTIYIQPTAAWQVRPWLRVGAGFDYIHSSVSLRQRVDLSTQRTSATGPTFGQLGIPEFTDFADAELTGSSWSAVGHFGVLLTPTDRVSIGARYLTRGEADIQGEATFSQFPTGIILGAGNPICGPPTNCPANTPLDSVLAPQFRGSGPLQTQHASTKVPLPDQLVIGTAVVLHERVRIMIDYQWVNWSKFSSLNLTFERLPARTLWEDYIDTQALRFGAEVTISDRFTARGGALMHSGAAPTQTVTPLLPEGERTEQTLGLGIRLSRTGRIDIAYQRIQQATRSGRIVDAPRGSTAFNSGYYSGSADLFGASLVWGF
jgi:long-chain fatty acid transport protein